MSRVQTYRNLFAARDAFGDMLGHFGKLIHPEHGQVGMDFRQHPVRAVTLSAEAKFLKGNDP